MKYQYRYKTTAGELWQLSMYYTYGSMIGVCNIIFTVALFALTGRMWTAANDFFRSLLVVGCLLFTVIQPLLVYRRARLQAGNITADTVLVCDDSGIQVTVGDQSSLIRWNQIKGISRKPTMLILFPDTVHGFVLTNRVLGREKEEFYSYVKSKINRDYMHNS